MGFECKILADSIAPCGERLTTKLVTYPRSIHSEIMTHKMLSKNSASSRAIPTEKLIERVMNDPFVPEYIGANQKGMQAGSELAEDSRTAAVSAWLDGRDRAVEVARRLLALGVHKQVANRVIEPYFWITVVISGTFWENFFGLRCHKDAEPHFQHIASMMRNQQAASVPKRLKAGEMHLPFIYEEDYPLAEEWLKVNRASLNTTENWGKEILAKDVLAKVSMGRTARVSYLTHEGKRDLQADLDLYARLAVQEPLHASPAEHVAMALDFPQWFKEERLSYPAIVGDTMPELRALRTEWMEGGEMVRHEMRHELELLTLLSGDLQSGNFLGFQQLRKTLKREHIGGYMP